MDRFLAVRLSFFFYVYSVFSENALCFGNIANHQESLQQDGETWEMALKRTILLCDISVHYYCFRNVKVFLRNEVLFFLPSLLNYEKTVIPAYAH